MHRHIRHLVVGLAAALALACSAAAAPASRSIQLRGAVENVHSEGSVTFDNEELLGTSLSIICDVTLLRTLASRIPKVLGTQFGKVTGLAIDRGEARDHHCAHGNLWGRLLGITPLTGSERPGTHRELGRGVLLYDVSSSTAWGVLYDGFGGTLPEISSLRLHIQNVQLSVEYIHPGTLELYRCLYSGDLPAAFGVERRVFTGLNLSLSALSKSARNHPLCFHTRLTTWATTFRTPALTIELL